ncbi:neuralized-like protein 4 [Babylonia areolata]|uniref:neuralized-like protein 4 n=1 Tax=Babylonia areolata TaxID=304850 RepID=UPI003FD60BE6
MLTDSVDLQMSSESCMDVDNSTCSTNDDSPAALTFHVKKKGEGVTLSNNQQTAEHKGFCVGGIVLACQPMEINCLYQVKVEKTKSLYSNSLIYLGVVTQDPEAVTLPRWPLHPKPSVVVYYQWVMVNGKKTKSQVGWALEDVKVGQCVGLMLDNRRSLHLYKDGLDQGVVAPDLPSPCHFMVDLGYCCKKATAMPVQRMM